MERPSFLDQKPPKGYVAGIGRGATGFSNRGDKTQRKVPARLQDRSNKLSKDKQKSQFTNANEKEEEEASQVFAMIDSRRNGNSKNKVTNTFQNHLNKSYQFQDLKRNLSSVSVDQWLSIPEANDFTRRNKRNRLEEQLNRKSYAVPDSLITQNVNITKLTEEREKLLEQTLDTNKKNMKIDKETEDINGAQSYLNQLEAVNMDINKTQTDDIRKMRLVFQSYRKTDPKNPESWIASTRLEEKCRRLDVAKKLIAEGCQHCPHDEDIWLENIRLNQSDNHKCKVIITNAIKFNYNSVKLWLKAVDLENEEINKYRIVRKALEEIPKTEQLWDLAIEYEPNTTEKATIMQKALEFIPQSSQLWTKLVRIQNYDDAKKSLNRARKAIPNDINVWLLAMELEEKVNKDISVSKLTSILKKGFEQLNANNITISFENGLEISEEFENNTNGKYFKSMRTLAKMILRETNNNTGTNISQDQLKVIFKSKDSLTKMNLLRELTLSNHDRFSLWKSLKDICENLNRIDDLYDAFETVLFHNSESNISKSPEANSKLILVYAKEVWKNEGNIERAIAIIDKGLYMSPDNVDILIAKLKLLCQSESFHEVEILFKEQILDHLNEPDTFKMKTGIERLCYKYISFLRYKNENQKAIELLSTKFIVWFPGCFKLYLQLSQVYYDTKDFNNAKQILMNGTELFQDKQNSHNALLWVEIAKIEEIAMENPVRARATLDVALLNNAGNIPGEILIQLAKINLEERTGNKEQAQLFVSDGLKKHPRNELFWVKKISLVDTKRSSQKKTMFQDALRNTKNNYLVILEIGKAFYRDFQYASALKWVERATKASANYGDSWIWKYRCEMKLKKDTKGTVHAVKSNEPIYGPEWISVSKNPKFQYFNSEHILQVLVQREISF
ncbi:hypothetical protein C6P45_001230 [Maudiozyma exigua]|uniref:PRP1 splicing factor N-terminal domain-containing protein n=1 Tax=Maudiozyma exigua TaxID=34358 RepID=A0A9P6W472_MAUEX|nr:hypothetical protein C6P45_001230 [Kazachstania exigua]